MSALSGCLIPIPAEEEQIDAGKLDNAPFIVSSTPSMAGALTLQAAPQTFTITVEDIDLDDVIYARVFRDYAAERLGPLAVGFGPIDLVNHPRQRTITLKTDTWCNGVVGNTSHLFNVVVADAPFNDDSSVAPAFQAVPAPFRSTQGMWVATCPTTTP